MGHLISGEMTIDFSKFVVSSTDFVLFSTFLIFSGIRLLSEGHNLLTRVCPPNEFSMEKVSQLPLQTPLFVVSALPLLWPYCSDMLSDKTLNNRWGSTNTFSAWSFSRDFPQDDPASFICTDTTAYPNLFVAVAFLLGPLAYTFYLFHISPSDHVCFQICVQSLEVVIKSS